MNSNKVLKILAFAGVVGLSANAVAVPITIEVVGANWTNIVGGSNVAYGDNDGQVGNEEIYWGGDTTVANKSGYIFDGAAPPALTVESGDEFILGSLTHINNVIPSNTAITSAQLNITADLLINGSSLTEGPFTFSFLHDETPNSCSPSPSCADDLVNFSPLDVASSFIVDGLEYTLNLTGFYQNGIITDTFRSPEGQSNTADLIASFNVRSVPEPGTFGLLSLSLAAMVVARKRTKA